MPVRQTVLSSRGHVPLIGQLDKGLSAIAMAAVVQTFRRLEVRRSPSCSFQCLFHSFSVQPSVLSVAFLCVLCVKFRKAQHRGHREPQSQNQKCARGSSISRARCTEVESPTIRTCYFSHCPQYPLFPKD